MALAGLGMHRMDFCATPRGHPNSLHANGYHRLHQTIVNPGMRPLGELEGDNGSRKRNHPGYLSNGSTTCRKGSTDVEEMKVESWVVPEKAKRVCLEHDRPFVSDVTTGQDFPTPSQHIPPPNREGHSTIQQEEHMNTSPTKCRRLRPYAVHEYNSCSHFQALSLSVLDCPRCLAGEPGHLTHLSGSQHYSTAMEIN